MTPKEVKKSNLYNEYADLLLEAEEEYERNRKSPEYYSLIWRADDKYREYEGVT